MKKSSAPDRLRCFARHFARSTSILPHQPSKMGRSVNVKWKKGKMLLNLFSNLLCFPKIDARGNFSWDPSRTNQFTAVQIFGNFSQRSAWHSCDRAFVFDVMLILTPQSIFRQTTLDVKRTFCTVRSLIHFPLRNNRRRCSESIIIFFSLRLFIFHYLINQQFSWNSICRLIERQEVRRRRIIILAAKHNQNCCGANRWSESDFNYFLLCGIVKRVSWTYLSSKFNLYLLKQGLVYFVCKLGNRIYIK